MCVCPLHKHMCSSETRTGGKLLKKYEFRERCVGTASLQTEATENNSELKSEDVVLKSASHLAATETAQCSISSQS